MAGLLEILQAFSDILSPVLRFVVWAFPIKISWLHEGECGVICTFGRSRTWRWPRSERGPGVTIYGPFEELFRTQATSVMADMVEQTVCFSDGRVAILNGSVVYNVTNASRAILKTHDHQAIVMQAAMNALRRWAADQPPTCITEAEDLTGEVSPIVNRGLIRYGCRVDRVYVTELRPDHVQMACDCARECTARLAGLISGMQKHTGDSDGQKEQGS